MTLKYKNTPWKVVETPHKNVRIIDCKHNGVTFWKDYKYDQALKQLSVSANKGLAISDNYFIFEEYRHPLEEAWKETIDPDPFDFLKELKLL